MRDCKQLPRKTEESCVWMSVSCDVSDIENLGMVSAFGVTECNLDQEAFYDLHLQGLCNSTMQERREATTSKNMWP
jgi:hypothetical protein